MKPLRLPDLNITYTETGALADIMESEPILQLRVRGVFTDCGTISPVALDAILANADAVRAWRDEMRGFVRPAETVEPVAEPVSKRPGKVDPRELPAIGERASVCPDCGVKAVRKVDGVPMCSHCGWKVGEG